MYESPARTSLLAALRTAIGDPDSARNLSQFITAEVIGRLLRTLHQEEAAAEIRSALVASQVIGVSVGCRIRRGANGRIAGQLSAPKMSLQRAPILPA